MPGPCRPGRTYARLMDAPFRLRLATPDGAEACGAVHHRSWVETYSHLLPPEHWRTDTVERRAALWTRVLRDGFEVPVAEVDGRIVGLALAVPGRTIGAHGPVRDRELSTLYVLAEHHGTGAGQALLDTALPPGTPAQLWVLDDNPRARRFYERNGFTPDGARHLDEGLGFTELRYIR